jgi:Ca2+-binding EF-hand superfamily protein
MSKKALYAVLLITGVAAAGGLAMAAEPYLPKGQKSFDRIDLNKDGKINLAEFTPVAEKRFLGIDVNKDNAVSIAEIDASLQAALERRRNRILSNLDADKNGSISRVELDSYIEAMVAGADTDSDGGISFSEARIFKIAKWRKALQLTSAN